MNNDDRRKRGERMFREVTLMEPFEPDDIFMEFTLDEVFGDVWSRPGLTRKERRLIALTTVAMSGSQTGMKVHFTAALKSGDITPEEMMEFLVQFAHYAGWPLTAEVHGVVRAAITELGLDVPKID